MNTRWHMLWALPWMLATWTLVEVLVFLPLYVAGVVAFPLAWRFAPKTYTQSWIWSDDRVIRTFRWPWLDAWLGNHEDGLLPFWWSNQGGTAYSWFLRNPVSNMRFWPVTSFNADPARVRYCGNVTEIVETPGWFVAWHGPYVGLRWIWADPFWGTKGLAIGWHLNPRDANGIPRGDVRRFGIGTVCQRLSADKVKA